jgi:hypothetical protein
MFGIDMTVFQEGIGGDKESRRRGFESKGTDDCPTCGFIYE